MISGLVLVVIVAAVLAVVLPPVLHGVVTDPAKAFYDEGNDLRSRGEYSAAIEKYQALMREFPDNEYVDEYRMEQLLAECYYNWAVKLANEKKYDEALEKYEMVRETYISEFYDEAKDGIGECYYNWAEDLRSQNNYPEALSKLNSIPYGAERYSDAESTMVEFINEWINHLLTTKAYDEAMRNYFIVLENYSDISVVSDWRYSDTAEVLKAVPPDALFAYATRIQQEGSYDDALKLYRTLLDYNPGSQLASEAEKAAIEIEIAQIAESEHGYLPPPPVQTPQQLEGKVEYEIKNDTSYTLTVLLSGPVTKSIVITSGGTKTLTLDPGTYRVAAKADSSSVIPYYGEATLAGDTQYESRFYISY